MKVIEKNYMAFLIIIILIAVSCKKTGTNPVNQGLSNEVQGVYTGKLKNSQTNQMEPATLNVTALNDTVISMHCISGNFDTTLNLMLYDNIDSIMLCYTGQDFFNEYGHNLDNHNFCNNKPENWQSVWEGDHGHWWGNQDNMWNAWNNHMNTQHTQGDEHYGSFDRVTHSCNFSFTVSTENTTYYEVFNGVIN